MKAKKIHEIQNFTRGGDPYAKLNVGLIHGLPKILDRELSQSGRLYKIHSVDNIEIYYLPGNFKDPMEPWFVEYASFTRYETFKNESSYVIVENLNNNYAVLWNHDSKANNKWIMKVPIHRDRPDQAKEQADIIVKAFNEHYGLAYGFKKKE